MCSGIFERPVDAPENKEAVEEEGVLCQTCEKLFDGTAPA